MELNNYMSLAKFGREMSVGHQKLYTTAYIVFCHCSDWA